MESQLVDTATKCSPARGMKARRGGEGISRPALYHYVPSKARLLEMLVIGPGIRGGEFRPVEPRVAALSVLGMCNWVAWRFHPGHAAGRACRR